LETNRKIDPEARHWVTEWLDHNELGLAYALLRDQGPIYDPNELDLLERSRRRMKLP